MNKINSMFAIAAMALLFTACKKDNPEPIIVVPPSDGSTLTLNGIVGSEAGSSAGNSVFVDLSAAAQTTAPRASWVLSFYSGNEFRARLNSTNGASAIILSNKTDLNSVTAADFDENDLAIQLGVTASGQVNSFANIDDVNGDPSKDIINQVAVNDAENKVYIINPAGGSHSSTIAVDKMFKVRVLRKGTGYTLQYAKVNESTFKTIDVAKNDAFNYVFVNLSENGASMVNVEPEKAKWDIMWSWGLYFGTAGIDTYPYGFSDLVFSNGEGGVTAAQVSTSAKAYADFGEADLTGVVFSGERGVIADKWRNTTGSAVGVLTDRFYLIKDAAGNIYKLKFVSFHAADGGERGKPVIEYKLVKQG